MARQVFPLSRSVFLSGIAALSLSACSQEGGLFGRDIDLDLRNMTGGFDTSDAARNVAARPAPDNRGVISYPNYQVVVAERGETVRQIANRLGLDADQLARFNGVEADIALREDEIIALPSRVSEPSPATGAVTAGPLQPTTIDVATLAGDAIDRAGTQNTGSNAPVSSGVEPVRHPVARGETAYQIARLYDVPVASLAQWNGLGPDLNIREGQQLLIPVAGAVRPASSAPSAPGAGSPTPTPPSATRPLPGAEPASASPTPAPAAPDIGQTTTAPATSAPFIYPVEGSIIRDYNPGRNEGIDIAALAGTPVKAAAAGTVAAITENTNGAQIIVIRHTGNILTVYVNVDDLSVSKDDTVSQGQTIAKVAEGAPSFLHFEVRDGLESVDPSDYLP